MKAHDEADGVCNRNNWRDLDWRSFFSACCLTLLQPSLMPFDASRAWHPAWHAHVGSTWPPSWLPRPLLISWSPARPSRAPRAALVWRRSLGRAQLLQEAKPRSFPTENELGWGARPELMLSLCEGQSATATTEDLAPTVGLHDVAKRRPKLT